MKYQIQDFQIDGYSRQLQPLIKEIGYYKHTGTIRKIYRVPLFIDIQVIGREFISCMLKIYNWRIMQFVTTTGLSPGYDVDHYHSGIEFIVF